MKQFVIVLVPSNLTAQDCLRALREHLPALVRDGMQLQCAQVEPLREEELPLWTWFLPNPSP